MPHDEIFLDIVNSVEMNKYQNMPTMHALCGIW